MQRLHAWHTYGLGGEPGSLATTTGLLPAPPGTEMVQFPGFPPQRVHLVEMRVAPFGNRGITAYEQLPHAYRGYVTSFIGTPRRGIHRLLILSSRSSQSRSARAGGAKSCTSCGFRRDVITCHQMHLSRYNHQHKVLIRVPSPLNREAGGSTGRRLWWSLAECVATPANSLERR